MKRRTFGIVVGLVYGITIAWGAFYQALFDDALMILATIVLGLGAGVISGGLLFALIALCPGEQVEHSASSARPDDYRAAA